MSKEEVDKSNMEHLTNTISISMEMFKYIMSNLAGNSNPGIGTGFSKSGV